jgi:hypothetical protein
MNNQTVSAAVQSLINSQGALQFSVDNIYRTMLHRPASAAEMQVGAAQIQAGLPESEIAIRLLSSPAFYQLTFASLKKK